MRGIRSGKANKTTHYYQMYNGLYNYYKKTLQKTYAKGSEQDITIQ